MKIAFLNFYSGLLNRGGETFIQELANRLAEENEVYVFQGGPKSSSEKYQVVTIDPSLPKVWPTQLFANNLRRRLFLDYYKLKELTFTLKAFPILNRTRPDVVIPINGGWQALLASVYCRLWGAKLVITGHSGPGFDDRWNLFVKPNLFVTLTQSQLAWAKRATIWKQDFALIPNGVDLFKFKPAGEKFPTVLEKPIILTVAASTPSKRVEQGIRAVAKLPQGSLLFVGTGPLDERLDKLGYKLLGKKRFFHTAAAYQQMPEYYRAADLFSLCSESSEAFGIVYLEALASGLACVATDDASRREIIGPAGVFVKNSNDSDEFAQALKSALKTDWRDLPRKQAEKFSWAKIARQYHEAFSDLNVR